MEKHAIQIGKLGSILGVLAGFVELSIGPRILPWIGNKESPFVLGIVTVILSGIAYFSFFLAGEQALPTNDRKLAIFLGVLLPAVICFTTVGRLWYLPGSLLLFTSFLLASKYWIRRSREKSLSLSSKYSQTDQIIGATGSLFILTSFGLAFFISTFGLFQAEILVDANNIRVQVAPMDIVRLENLTANVNTMEEREIGLVMFVYILLILGASISLISSLADSRFFRLIGGLIVLAGLILFPVAIPMILEPMGVPPVNLLELFGSLGAGWYLSTIGMILIMISSLFRYKLRNGNN